MSLTRNGELTPSALRRFGLGARPGDLKAIGDDPKGAILAELATRSAPLRGDGVTLHVDLLYYAWRKHDLRPFQMEELKLRLRSAQDPLVGFNERLVWFWTNHLCVSAAKNHLMGYLVGPYEREAIRPHVFGRFEDLLLASARHAAMLTYLDNLESVGPGSPAGRAGTGPGKGINENYAREVMELHTLGVGGGYTQADVTKLARILSGWTFTREQDAPKPAGAFVFRPEWHEPGAQIFLGRRYAQEGEAQGEAALKALAAHPSTAKFLAFKLAQAFVADAPPPALVDRMAAAYRKSDGDLSVVCHAMLDSPEAWTGFGSKLRGPMEVVVASNRAMGAVLPEGKVYDLTYAMGQLVWVAPSPRGFEPTIAALANPVTAKGRIDTAAQLANVAPKGASGAVIARETLGDLASLDLLKDLAAADAQGFGVALLFASPEFQRR